MATKKEIQDEIAEYEALLKDSTVPQDEKDFAKEEIADLKKQLEEMDSSDKKLGKKEPKAKKEKKAKAPKKEKAVVKPAKSKKAKKEKSAYTYKGRAIHELSEEDCDQLRKDIEARREAARKSDKKSKSKPVIEKVAGNVATAVKQAIEAVPAADIDKGEINKFERIEKLAKDFLAEMKSILGEEFDSKTVQDEFKHITDLIEELRKKYTK